MCSCLALRLSVLFSLGTLFLTSCGPERGRGETAVVSTAVIDSCADAETPGLEVSVYSNGPDNCFGVDGWGTFDPAQTAVVHSGATAVSFVPSNWSGLSFSRSGLRTSFSGVELWVHGGSTGGQLVKLEVKAGGKTVARTSLAAALGEPLPAGEWRKVTVTFAQPTLSSSLWIVLEATTGDQQAAIYLDDVRLATTSAGSCATGAPAGSSCSDANLCNGEEYCDGNGHCLQGVAPQTDDGNPCTLDSCDPVVGVQHQPLPAGTSCTYESTCSGVGSCDGAGSCQTGVAAADLRVYSDSLEACFVDWSESIHDTGQWTTVHSGYRAVSYEPDNWRSLDFHRDSLSGSYNAVEFWVNGGAAGGQQVWITVNNQGNQILSSRISDVLGQPIAAATWQRVLVPFPVSLVAGSFDIVFEAQTSLDQPTLFIDDVRLVAQSAPGPCDGAAAGTSCSDGNACNGDELCDGFGSCLAGTPPVFDDGNPCTADACDPALGVTHTPLASGTACSDGNACNGLETCNGAGTCLVGTAPVVDDGNPCTVDSCDPVLGVIHTPVAAGTSCSDGNACNGLETCNGAGVCVAGTPPTIDDGNPCTIDSCDPLLGVIHTPVAAGTSCSDGNLCNGDETCNGAGVCVAGTPPTIDDGNPCTADSCIPSTGVVHSPIPNCNPNPTATVRGRVEGRDGGPLGGVAITVLDHPELGSTLTGTDGQFELVVSGNGQLTVNYQKDGYPAVQRLVEAPSSGEVWADEVVLVPYDSEVTSVTPGAATAQVARGTLLTDGRGTRRATLFFPPGTQASMILPDSSSQALTGATHVRATEFTVGAEWLKTVPAVLPPAGNPTYVVELSLDEAVTVGASSVQFSQAVALYVENFLGFSAGSDLSVAYYDRAESTWIAENNGRAITVLAVNGGAVDLDVDGDGAADDRVKVASLGITDGERQQMALLYQPGMQVWRVSLTHFTPVAVGRPLAGACSGAAAGTSCSDGNACNGLETCDGAGHCLAGTPPVVEDGNPCTLDACDPVVGVTHTPVPAGTSCSDGNACNGLETCSGAGACVARAPPDIDDGNPCTIDNCDPVRGVVHTPAPAGTSCSDGNACNGPETCNGAGFCVTGAPPVLEDNNPCTVDVCNPVLGVIHTPAPAGTSCSDGNLCNGSETCNGSGVCVAGTPPPVDDGEPCTDDECVPGIGIVHTPNLSCGASCHPAPGNAFRYDAVGNLTAVINASSDVNNCGCVGRACPGAPNASVACSNAVCGLSRGGQFYNVSSDPMNCGDIGHICTNPAHGTAVCNARRCGVVCGSGYEPAGELCVDLMTDPANCGEVGRVCPRTPNAAAACEYGNCGVSSGGRFIDVSSDPANCGDVGMACPSVVNGLATCTSGFCGIQCEAGYTPTGDKCVDLMTDPTNCGWVGHVCQESGNGTAACTKGRCGTIGVPTVYSVNGVFAPGRQFKASLWAGLRLVGEGLEKVTSIELEDWSADTIGGDLSGEESIPVFTGQVVTSAYDGLYYWPIPLQTTSTDIVVPGAVFANGWANGFYVRHWYKARLHYLDNGLDNFVLVDVAVSFNDQLPTNLPPPVIDAVGALRQFELGGRDWMCTSSSDGYDAATGFLAIRMDLTVLSSPPVAVLGYDLLHTEYPIVRITHEGVYIEAGLNPDQVVRTEGGWFDLFASATFVFPYTNSPGDAVHLGWGDPRHDLNRGGILLRGTNLVDDGRLIISNPVGSALPGELPHVCFGDRIIGWPIRGASEPIAYVELDSARGVVATPWPLDWVFPPVIYRINGVAVDPANPMSVAPGQTLAITGRWLSEVNRAVFDSWEIAYQVASDTYMQVTLPEQTVLGCADGGSRITSLSVNNAECLFDRCLPYVDFLVRGLPSCPSPPPPPPPAETPPDKNPTVPPPPWPPTGGGGGGCGAGGDLTGGVCP